MFSRSLALCTDTQVHITQVTVVCLFLLFLRLLYKLFILHSTTVSKDINDEEWKKKAECGKEQLGMEWGTLQSASQRRIYDSYQFIFSFFLPSCIRFSRLPATHFHFSSFCVVAVCRSRWRITQYRNDIQKNTIPTNWMSETLKVHNAEGKCWQNVLKFHHTHTIRVMCIDSGLCELFFPNNTQTQTHCSPFNR